jgi:hypothetical protein
MKIGDKFYKRDTELAYLDNCTNCGRERKGTSPKYPSFGDDYCANCGRAYHTNNRIIVPVYVTATGINFKGETTVALSAKSPEELLADDKQSYSYWNTTVDKLGVEYWRTEKEAMEG